MIVLGVILLAMLFAPIALIAFVAPNQGNEFLAKVQAAVLGGSWAQIRPLFARPELSRELEAMAPGAVIKQWKADALVAPPGYEGNGKTWIVFHKYQELEATHDVVYPLVETAGVLRLGPEIPEDIPVRYRVERYDFEIAFDTPSRRAAITTTCQIQPIGDASGTLLMRMNDAYVVTKATLEGKDVTLASAPQAGKTTLVQSGGILYITNAARGGKLSMQYSVSLDLPELDKTTENQLLLTSYWYPHIGRQPAPSRTRVTGPKDWVFFANGDVEGEKTTDTTRTVQFKNPVPLSWFHVCGGPYKLVAEVESRGRKIRAWHINPNEARGKKDVESARDAIAYFEDRFGPFPYNHYDVVDTPDFYGVESYSFTVLQPDITVWATSHEIGHTYFGGLAPNSYIGSIWNESIAQYVDSIQLKNNSDRSLQSGYASRNQAVALTDSFTPHGPFGNTGYYRGAFVMKMLENEIGIDTMNRALRQLVSERRGKLTDWVDIEQVFVKNAGSIEWFFDQWMRGRTFPKVAVARGLAEKIADGRYNTNLILNQTGTAMPYKLKFDAVIELVDGEKRFPIKFDRGQAEFDFETSSRPRRISFDPIGWTLATVPATYTLTNGKNLAR